MSRRPKCVYRISRDNTASICLWCENPGEARKVVSEYEEIHRDVRCGICPACIEKYHANSLRGSPWALAG